MASRSPFLSRLVNFTVLLRASCVARMGGVLTVLAGLCLTGCCTPIGPGCTTGNCHDCDGTAGRPIPYAPFQNIKRQLICGGGGCGEVYIGEWISTPPDCCDPCCGDQWVGGAVPSRPFCWQPGSLLNLQRFSGRFDEGHDDGECCGDSVADSSYFDEGYSDGGYIESTGHPQHSTGCATCSSNSGYSRSYSHNNMHPGQTSHSVSRPATRQTHTSQTATTNNRNSAGKKNVLNQGQRVIR